MFSDSIFLAVDVHLLHCRLRRMGVAGREEVPGVPTVGHPSPGGARVRRRRYSDSSLLLLRYRHEHCRAYIALRVCGGL